MRVKKTVGDKEKLIEEITQEIERLVNDPEERKKTEEFVRKVSYLSPEDLITIFDIWTTLTWLVSTSETVS